MRKGSLFELEENCNRTNKKYMRKMKRMAKRIARWEARHAKKMANTKPEPLPLLPIENDIDSKANEIEKGHYDFGEPITLSLSESYNTRMGPHSYQQKNYDTNVYSATAEESKTIQGTHTKQKETSLDETMDRTSEREKSLKHRDAPKPNLKQDDGIEDAIIESSEPDFANTIQAEDEAFVEDIKAILSKKKRYDVEKKQIVEGAPSSGRKKESDPVPKAAAEEEAKNEHDIFEKISQSMRMANSYDLGAITLDQRFDKFDQELDYDTQAKKKNKQKKSQLKNHIQKPKEQEDQNEQGKLDELDLLEDLEQLAKQQSYASSFSNEIPLSPESGGRSIETDPLEVGDVLLSTTADPRISGAIRAVTLEPVSHASVYIGEGRVIEAVESGVLERTLETAMEDDTVTVAFRHHRMTLEKATKIKTFLQQKRAEGTKFDHFAVVRNLPIQVISSFCAILNDEWRDRCRNFAGRIFLGTETNNEFYCSELVFAAFQEAGLKLANTEPQWTSPEDLVQLNYNGTLRYVGHLKTT